VLSVSCHCHWATLLFIGVAICLFVVRCVIVYLFTILPSGRIQALDEICSMSKEHCVAGSTTDHGQHCEPHICQTLGWKPTIPDTQHMRHGLKQGPRILLNPVGLLEPKNTNQILINQHKNIYDTAINSTPVFSNAFFWFRGPGGAFVLKSPTEWY
jgi:hypothetical protein